ncbi:unnamed protein product [Staurois parvus]|uniref:G-protein coupled receptors family 1 profile domain-containing protein n=1 Tax=Staurois parvus TaxID=386267 RepID=A0ABN9FDK9_9NEOB|nr:unnamed protein product [Staurois parvus]
MFVLGSSGNIYVLVITALSPRPAGSLCINVINLALADLLYLLTIPFVLSTYLAQNWYFGDIGCRVLLSMDLLTMHASIYTLTAMSLQRYQVIVRPFKAHITQCHQKVTSLAIWLTSFFSHFTNDMYDTATGQPLWIWQEDLLSHVDTRFIQKLLNGSFLHQHTRSWLHLNIYL